MNANTVDKTEIVSNHEEWEANHANWLRDVLHWHKEHEEALSELDRLKAIITDHIEAVRHHADTVVAHEKMLVNHARIMGEDECADDLENPMVTVHRHVARADAQLADTHGRMKEHHESVMYQLRTLSRILGEGV